MAVRIKSNVQKQANRLGRMTGVDAENLTQSRLAQLAKRYVPVFAGATPKKTGKAARSIKVVQDTTGEEVTVRMIWGTDYIDDVNRNEGENQNFAENQFKSIANRVNAQAKQEIGRAFQEAGKKNKLKVKR